jgi:hypothetical protein
MTDTWLIQDIEKNIAQRNRVVIIDPTGEYSYLLPHIKKKHYIILKTDTSNTEEWQRIKEELLLRYEAESTYKNDKVVFYVTRTKEELSFLFDYCFTHGCVDLTKPVEWLRNKLFTATQNQITLDNPMLLIAAKMGVGKDVIWWKKILQNLEELVSIEDELIPFLCNPDIFFKDKLTDVKRLFEEKLFDLIGQSYRKVPAKTLATEVVHYLFLRLLHNDISTELLSIYHKWLDSHTYSKNLTYYIDAYKIDTQLDIWKVHPDHCFSLIDKRQLAEITSNFRDKGFVRSKLQKLNQRIGSRKAIKYIPSWWNDLITLFEFDNRPLNQCQTLEKVSNFYTSSFYKLDRAIRNFYEVFLQEELIIRPLQEHYESLNLELLQHWFEYTKEYQSNQQGFLPRLISQSKPGTAIIVGDGIRYEIAAFVATQLQSHCTITLDTMFADMPSETEHNMSALYAGNHQVILIHKDREKILSEITGKEINYLNLEALHYGIKADYLVLTYKDIDSAGEKLQMGALKLFSEFEKVLTEKIKLLLNMGFHQVHLVTDHGFVLTGILENSDKIEVDFKGNVDKKERFIRTQDRQNIDSNLLIEKEVVYNNFNYCYFAKRLGPFKSPGVYGFSHGGLSPQETIIPFLKWSNENNIQDQLQVMIVVLLLD